MDVEVKAVFKDRRAAELALEHLVQDIGLDRTDVFIAARGSENTSGAQKAGADSQSSLSEPRGDKDPKLNGDIELSAGCESANAGRVSEALKDAGGNIIE